MKNLMTLALGLSLAFGAVTVAASDKKEDKKEHKDKKDHKDHKDDKKKKDH